MVPIHESDLAEKRFQEAEWKDFELWEKAELKLRRKKFLFVGLTSFIFLCLIAVPVIQDRSPKWRGLSAMRKLALRVNEMKVQASNPVGAMTLELVQKNTGEIDYRIY